MELVKTNEMAAEWQILKEYDHILSSMRFALMTIR